MFQTDKNLYLPIALERKAIGLLIPVRFCSSCSPPVPLIIQPPVHNLRPCADVMYESLCKVRSDNILCVVLTGMGADGTEGIGELKKSKHIYTISQDEESCVVYGMPKSVHDKGLSDEVKPITEIAKSISRELGV